MTQASTPDCNDYIAGLIGLPWEARATGPTSYDCYGLVCDVQRRLFKRDLPLAEAVTRTNFREIQAAIRDAVIQRAWCEVSSPRHGDLVLMGRRSDPCHIGVWLELGGQRGCLHAEQGLGVVFQSLAELRVSWLRLDFRRYSGSAVEAISATRVAARNNVPQIVVVADPLNPGADINIHETRAGLSVEASLREVGICASDHWLCHNTTPLLRNNPQTGEDEWKTKSLAAGDLLWVLPVPLEGGGDGGSQTLATIAAVTLAIAAPYAVAGFGSAALGTTAAGLTFAGQIAAAGLTITGTYLIGQLVPQPRINAPLTTPEPTYGFGSVSNQVRPGAKVPRIYGTIHRTPDLLCAPWTHYDAAGDQFLNVLLCLGAGDYRLNEFGVGDTTVWTASTGLSETFPSVEFEFLHPGDPLTLFPAAVETSGEVGGIVLPEPEAETDPVGPFVAVAREKQAEKIICDFVFPGGLFDTNGSGGIISAAVEIAIEAREIDESNEAIGDWVVLRSFEHSAASNTPQRITQQIEVSPARYEVRCSRVTPSALTGDVGADAVNWSALRAVLIAPNSYDAVSLLAVTMRADETTSSAALSWFADTTAILPFIKTDGSLDTAPTEAIEAAVLDIVTSDYGLGLGYDRIDAPALQGLAQTWRDRGDVCCTSVEAVQGAWDLLEDVLTVGRARPQFIGNMITFVRDEHIAVPARLVTQSDIVRGSLSIERVHHTRQTPNAVRMRYRNRAGDLATVDCVPEGVETPSFKEITSQFIVDEAHARREGLYLASANRLRRRYVRFTLLEAGRALVRGQLISVAHPRPVYGRSARLVDHDWPQLVLSSPHELSPGEAAWIALQRPDGSYWGPCKVLRSADDAVQIDETDFSEILSQPNDDYYSRDPRDWIVSELSTDGAPTRLAIGTDQSAPIRCKVVEVEPRVNGQVDVLALQEVDAVHLADGVAITEADIVADTDIWLATPVGVAQNDEGRNLYLSLETYGPAEMATLRYYIIEWRPVDGPWTSHHWDPASGSSLILPVASGLVYLRMRAGWLSDEGWNWLDYRLFSISQSGLIATLSALP